MIPDQSWPTDARFSKIAPHLPTDTRGKARVDDRRVIGGIVQVLKSGGRWIDAPPESGPRKTLYNHYVRWAAKGVWVELFHALAQAGGPPAEVLIDSSAVKAHRSASGGEGGEKSGHRPLARRTHHQNPRADRREPSSHRLHADRRQCRRLRGGRRTSGAASAMRNPARRQGLRQRRHPSASRAGWRGAEHPAQGQSQMEERLFAVPPSQSQRHRAHVPSIEGLQAGRDAI